MGRPRKNKVEWKYRVENGRDILVKAGDRDEEKDSPDLFKDILHREGLKEVTVDKGSSVLVPLTKKEMIEDSLMRCRALRDLTKERSELVEKVREDNRKIYNLSMKINAIHKENEALIERLDKLNTENVRK